MGEQVILTEQNISLMPPDYVVEYSHHRGQPEHLSVPGISKSLPIIFDTFYGPYMVRYKLALPDSKPYYPFTSELQEIASVTLGKHNCYPPSYEPMVGYQFGYGSSSVGLFRMHAELRARLVIYSIVESDPLEGIDDSATMGGSSAGPPLMVTDLVSGVGADNTVSICSASGRMMVRDDGNHSGESIANVPRVFEFVR
jgi:hypothetical protein